MEIRQLKYFVTIATTKNYSLAAKSLFVTQPTLSWNIQQLEEEFNTRLFFSTKNGLQLTESGKQLFVLGQKLLDDYDSLITQMQKVSSQKKTLKVGMTVLFAIQYMEQITHFLALNPGIELLLTQSGSVEIQDFVAKNEVDIGLVSFPVYDSSIEIDRLKTSHAAYGVSVVVPANHPLADKKSIWFKDLEGYPLCAFTEDFVLGKILYERSMEYGFKPNVIFTNKNWEVLLQHTLIANAITLMPQPFEELTNFEGLKWIPLKDKANLFEIGVAYKKGRVLEDHAVQFIEFIKEN